MALRWALDVDQGGGDGTAIKAKIAPSREPTSVE